MKISTKISIKTSIKTSINIALLIIIFILGYTTFVIKATTQNFNYQLMFIEKQIKQENQQINLLKTEFSYLTNAARINALANQYLNLDNIKLAQLQDTITKDNPIQNDLEKDSKIKWRYKNSASRYLKNIGNRNIFTLAKN